uniref:Reverse transcriptase domain-containing protein n=1 Tax=Tanacetum cinerariifolium TaxID=118510 RepID=A0A6L2JAB8_TANCI|nr:reverse transcriptase domain-containing protein [Tanacetum cinerariifolium]
MSTRSSARNVFPPLDNPKLTIRRRSRIDPTRLNNSEMAIERPGDLPVPNLRTMEELCQPSLNGRNGPITPIASQETNFRLKNDMIQQTRILANFMEEPCPEKCYDLIENMTAHHNDWDTSAQRRAYQGNSYQPQGNRNLLSPGRSRRKHQSNAIVRVEKLALLDFSPTCMTLELADRLISRSIRVAEDVFVKVGTFHFPADFVVVDFDTDTRVPLILERSFLKTGRALIDVFEGELTLRFGKQAITFNLDQTSRYSANYNDMTANRIDVIDMACEEYSQKVLGFSDVIASGNPTPYYDPVVSTTSLTLTPFGNSDFLLEEVGAFLALEDDPTSPEVDQSYVDTEGD